VWPPQRLPFGGHRHKPLLCNPVDLNTAFFTCHWSPSENEHSLSYSKLDSTISSCTVPATYLAIKYDHYLLTSRSLPQTYYITFISDDNRFVFLFVLSGQRDRGSLRKRQAMNGFALLPELWYTDLRYRFRVDRQFGGGRCL